VTSQVCYFQWAHLVWRGQKNVLFLGGHPLAPHSPWWPWCPAGKWYSVGVHPCPKGDPPYGAKSGSCSLTCVSDHSSSGTHDGTLWRHLSQRKATSCRSHIRHLSTLPQGQGPVFNSASF
jgi:hypothetical protein